MKQWSEVANAMGNLTEKFEKGFVVNVLNDFAVDYLCTLSHTHLSITCELLTICSF